MSYKHLTCCFWVRTVVMFSCVAICNLVSIQLQDILVISIVSSRFSFKPNLLILCLQEGLVLDVIGLVLKHIKHSGETATRLRTAIKSALHHNEFPYDW